MCHCFWVSMTLICRTQNEFNFISYQFNYKYQELLYFFRKHWLKLLTQKCEVLFVGIHDSYMERMLIVENKKYFKQYKVYGLIGIEVTITRNYFLLTRQVQGEQLWQRDTQYKDSISEMCHTSLSHAKDIITVNKHCWIYKHYQTFSSVFCVLALCIFDKWMNKGISIKYCVNYLSPETDCKTALAIHISVTYLTLAPSSDQRQKKSDIDWT